MYLLSESRLWHFICNYLFYLSVVLSIFISIHKVWNKVQKVIITQNVPIVDHLWSIPHSSIQIRLNSLLHILPRIRPLIQHPIPPHVPPLIILILIQHKINNRQRNRLVLKSPVQRSVAFALTELYLRAPWVLNLSISELVRLVWNGGVGS